MAMRDQFYSFGPRLVAPALSPTLEPVWTLAPAPAAHRAGNARGSQLLAKRFADQPQCFRAVPLLRSPDFPDHAALRVDQDGQGDRVGAEHGFEQQVSVVIVVERDLGPPEEFRGQ